MKRNTLTFALVLLTVCFALIGNGCSKDGAGLLGPEEIAASQIPSDGAQQPFRAPEAPVMLEAGWSRGGVNLEWACDCDAVTFFRVYRKLDGGAPAVVRATSHTSATDDLRYVNYQKAVYFVTGVDAYGNESAASNRIGVKKGAAKLPEAGSVDNDSRQ